MKYIGIDGCKSGWFYIRFNKKQSYDFGILKTIDELSNIANLQSNICIDIPIGLREEDTRERLCDKEARKLLKKRGSSVFPAPSRLSLVAEDYHKASELNKRYTGRKLSLQSFHISKKIKEVDDFIQNLPTAYRIRECHPELCFLAFNNFEPLKYSKKKKEGRTEREEVLSKYFGQTSNIIKDATRMYLRKQVAHDDILDALAGAVTASFEERIIGIPHQPEIDNKKILMQIVYP